MKLTIKPHIFSGVVPAPPSKSHTIRALFAASACEGVSVIKNPLRSLDTDAAMRACTALGAVIQENEGGLVVKGCLPQKRASGTRTIDCANSGTTLFFALASAALGAQEVTFTGDSMTSARSAAPLLDALTALGARVTSNGGCLPITVRGPLCAEKNLYETEVYAPTSQFLSALLLFLPLLPQGKTVKLRVMLLNEAPYIKMTLAYLKNYLTLDGETARNIENIPRKTPFSVTLHGGASYAPFNLTIPGDFSQSAYLAAAALSSGSSSLTITGLDFQDTQGDKVFFEIISRVFRVEFLDNAVKVSSIYENGAGGLGDIDLNAAPDLLPALAVIAALCKGTTRIYGVKHARIKETDRIAVMARELSKMGVDISETEDGLVIRGGSRLKGGSLSSDGDHRVFMALAAAALGVEGVSEIEGAESAAVSYPDFARIIGSG